MKSIYVVSSIRSSYYTVKIFEMPVFSSTVSRKMEGFSEFAAWVARDGGKKLLNKVELVAVIA